MSTHLDDLFAPYSSHLSVTELATLLGVTQKTAYDYLQAGGIPAYRVCKKWLILRDDIRDFLEESSLFPHNSRLGFLAA